MRRSVWCNGPLGPNRRRLARLRERSGVSRSGNVPSPGRRRRHGRRAGWRKEVGAHGCGCAPHRADPTGWERRIGEGRVGSGCPGVGRSSAVCRARRLRWPRRRGTATKAGRRRHGRGMIGRSRGCGLRRRLKGSSRCRSRCIRSRRCRDVGVSDGPTKGRIQIDGRRQLAGRNRERRGPARATTSDVRTDDTHLVGITSPRKRRVDVPRSATELVFTQLHTKAECVHVLDRLGSTLVQLRLRVRLRGGGLHMRFFLIGFMCPPERESLRHLVRPPGLDRDDPYS